MKNISNLLILLCFVVSLGVSLPAGAEPKKSWWGWSKNHKRNVENNRYNPYLEDARHVQIPQWSHKDWYAEDWLSQKDGMELVQGFYSADILNDQITNENGQPILVVGPNFYRLGGYDKRRVAHIVDVTYGVTKSKEDGSFMLMDWNSSHYIGVFDKNGLRLH